MKTVPLTNTETPLPLGIFVREFNRQDDVQIEFIHRPDCLSAQEVEWLQQRFMAHLELFSPGRNALSAACRCSVTLNARNLPRGMTQTGSLSMAARSLICSRRVFARLQITRRLWTARVTRGRIFASTSASGSWRRC